MRTHYGPWQPCWISNQHQKHKSGRGPSSEHFWQVWLISVQRFQRRRFKCEKLTDGRRTLTHDKSSHGLWPGELKILNTEDTVINTLTNKSFTNVTRLTIQWHLQVFRIINKIDIFPWCVPLIKSRSLNWPWSTKILGEFKHILTSTIKTIVPVLKISTYVITSITAHPIWLAAILAIMSVSTFKTAVILYITYIT